MAVALVLSIGMAGPAHGGHESGAASGVAAQQLAASAHRSLGCGSCHGEMEHGSRGSAAQSCQGCHRRMMGMMYPMMGQSMMGVGMGPGMMGGMMGMSDPKAQARMLKLRGDMMKAMGEVLLKHAQEIEQAK